MITEFGEDESVTAMKRGERAGEEVEERRDSKGGYAWGNELCAVHKSITLAWTVPESRVILLGG